MPGVIASSDGFFDAEPGQVSLDHRSELANKIFSAMSSFPNIRASVKNKRTPLEPHLFGAFKRQSFWCRIAGENPPGSRPAIAPARKDQFAKRYFGGNVLRIGSGYQKLVLEKIKLTAEQEPLDLVFYFAQIESDVGTHHARVLAVSYGPGQEVTSNQVGWCCLLEFVRRQHRSYNPNLPN